MKNIILGFLLIIVILGLLYYFNNVKEGLSLANPNLGTIPPFEPTPWIQARAKDKSAYVMTGGAVIDKYFVAYVNDFWNRNVLATKDMDAKTQAINRMNAWGQDWLSRGILTGGNSKLETAINFSGITAFSAPIEKKMVGTAKYLLPSVIHFLGKKELEEGSIVIQMVVLRGRQENGTTFTGGSNNPEANQGMLECIGKG